MAVTANIVNHLKVIKKYLINVVYNGCHQIKNCNYRVHQWRIQTFHLGGGGGGHEMRLNAKGTVLSFGR